ncbi:MAG: hypothetical protein ACU0A6_04950 [Shimia sp.]|uniref:hypothetical protein n=1 Tax=Shimia sp. TaxID=1954381 RepID=UPI00405A3CD3
MTRAAFTRLVKTRSDGAAVPLIIVDNQPTHVRRIAALQAGADDVVASPLKEAPFLARIRCLLRARDTVQSLRLHETAASIPGLAEDALGFDAPSSVVFAAPHRADAVNWSARLKLLAPYRMRAFPIGDMVRSMSLYAVPDAFVIGVAADSPDDSLRLLAEIRARVHTAGRCADGFGPRR